MSARWAISGWQPWWWALVMGFKPIENRVFSSSVAMACRRYRGPVLLHASASVGRRMEDFEDACDFVSERVPMDAWQAFAKACLSTKIARDGQGRKVERTVPSAAMQRGGIIGEAEVMGMLDPDGKPIDTASRVFTERFGADWEDVRAAWHIPGQCGILVGNPRPLPFIPCKGALGLWRFKEAT